VVSGDFGSWMGKHGGVRLESDRARVWYTGERCRMWMEERRRVAATTCIESSTLLTAVNSGVDNNN
jgi:hypothetical protein